MSLVPPTLTPRKAIAGLVIVFSVFLGILVAIGADKSKASEVPDNISSSVTPSPSVTGTPGNPNQTPSPVPSPVGTLPPVPRDLSQYENGGTLTVGFDVSPANREQVLEQLRTFVLRKWNARQRGRLAFVSFSPRNQPLTRSFFVEPNATGVWQISLEIPSADPKIYRFAQEIGVAADGQPILEPTRPGAPQAVTRALHLKASATLKNGLIF